MRCAGIVIVLLALGVLGCSSSSTTTPAGSGNAAVGHTHDDHSGHGHGELGPHDGHILETSDGHFHAEWTHADDGRVTVYILDSSGKEDHPIASKTVAIETIIKGGEAKTYTLNAMDEGDQSVAFETSDLALLAVLKIAGDDGATATLKFSAEGKEVTAEIKHADHDHAH